MPKTQQLILHPTLVHHDELMTIKSGDGNFNTAAYIIQNDSGNTIRKGNIQNSYFSFQIRIVGLRAGTYKFIMGDQQEVFHVIS